MTVNQRYDGDVLITFNQETGEMDMIYENGQPKMTQGFETCLLLAIFGEDCAQNGMTTESSQRFESRFPSIIRRGRVDEDTKKDGIAAIERALSFMVTAKMASTITVTGQITGVHSIFWNIDIESPGGNGGKYELNWANGGLTFGYRA